MLSLEQRPGVVSPTGNHWDESCSLGRADHDPQRQRGKLAKQIAAQLKLRKRTTFSKTRNRKLAKSRKDLVEETASGRKTSARLCGSSSIPYLWAPDSGHESQAIKSPPHWF